MTYAEIFEWVKDNAILDPSKNSEENFAIIEEGFNPSSRSDLSDILGDEKVKFLEWIEEQTRQSRADIEIKESEGLIKSVTKFLRGLFR